MSNGNMLKCAYVVLLYNNEINVADLVESLKNLNGNFRKEYIFVDDGSSDNTLAELKRATIDLPRSTIITQEHQGFSLCINKALKIAHCDYVHFVSGHEILHPDATILLLDACAECDAEVALGNVSHEKILEGGLKGAYRCIHNPLKDILEGKISRIKEIGGAATLVSKALLDRIDYADSVVYSHLMSLSLRCSMHSTFTVIPECITYTPEILVVSDKKFESHNNLRAIYNFIKSNKEVAKQNIPSLAKALYLNVLDYRSKIKYLTFYMLAKSLKTVSYKQIVESYKIEYEKLF